MLQHAADDHRAPTTPPGAHQRAPATSTTATLDVTASPATPTTILIGGTGDTLATNNLPNTTIDVQGNYYFNTNATLTVANGLVNHGTILLDALTYSYTDTLATGSGTFTNAGDGTITINNGSGGPRTISGTLVNQGQITVSSASLLTIQGTYNAAGGSISWARLPLQRHA